MLIVFQNDVSLPSAQNDLALCPTFAQSDPPAPPGHVQDNPSAPPTSAHDDAWTPTIPLTSANVSSSGTHLLSTKLLYS